MSGDPPERPGVKTSRELLAEQIAQERAKARAIAAGTAAPGLAKRHTLAATVLQVMETRGISVSDLKAEEAARAKAAPVAVEAAPIGGVLPQAAAVALGAAHVVRPLLQAADVAKFRFRPLDAKAWEARMRAIASGRKAGDPMQPLLERFAQYVARIYQVAKRPVQITYKRIASALGVGPESARMCARFWTANPGVLDIGNVMGWHVMEVCGQERRLLLREANVYVPRLPDAVDAETEGETTAVELRPLARFQAQLQRWAGWFGLAVRPWGLNTTPLAARRLDPKGRPAPA